MKRENMEHVAIMKKSLDLIPKIVSGEKTIESRWYRTRRTPWNKIRSGEHIFFKNAGEPVIAKATVSGVLQFELADLFNIRKIVQKYGEKICLVNRDPHTWGRLPKYCILIHLKNPEMVRSPFHINKQGFGNNTAWITTDSILKIKIK